MKNLGMREEIMVLVLLTSGLSRLASAPLAQENRPPEVFITWPQPGDAFSTSTLIKIKADAIDAGGAITEVRFLADTKVIGVATDPPFTVVWQVSVDGPDFGMFTLKAVALDNLGASRDSA